MTTHPDGLRPPQTSSIRIIALAVFAVVAFAWHAGDAHAYVYWSDDPGGAATIGRADLDGTGVDQNFITGLSGTADITVSSSHIYWAQAEVQNSQIGRANLDGTGVNQSFIPSAGADADGIAVDSGHIYWSDANYIGRANLDGSSPNPHFIQASTSGDLSSLALSGTTLYFSIGADILQVPEGGGTVTSLLTIPGTMPTIAYLTVGGAYIYWSEVDLGGVNPVSSIGRALIADPGGTNNTSGNYLTGVTEPSGVSVAGNGYLYWGDDGPDTVGRAVIGSLAAGTPTFALFSANAPVGVVTDELLDPTTTAVACLPATFSPGVAASCTATVTDIASPSVPGGQITFSGNSTTSFGTGDVCTLTAINTTMASCTVSVIATAAGTATVTAAFARDSAHDASSGTASASVVATSGTTSTSSSTTGSTTAGATAIGGSTATATSTTTTETATVSAASTPPTLPSAPGLVVCLVPKLVHKTAARARFLLQKAGCALGQVSRPKQKHGHTSQTLLVSSQLPAAGRSVARGTPVAIRLAATPKPRHRR